MNVKYYEMHLMRYAGTVLCLLSDVISELQTQVQRLVFEVTFE
jgi:hypothetical protein